MLKRLIKKSNYDIKQFIKLWFENDGAPDENQINMVMIDNPDCLYKDEAYRFIKINIDDIDLDNITDDDIKQFKSQIRIDKQYRSWAKSYYATEQYAENNFGSWQKGVIITCEIIGLDFEKLFKKYKDKFDEEDAEYYQEGIKNEEEVIAKMPNSYDIFEVYYDGEFYEL